MTKKAVGPISPLITIFTAVAVVGLLVSLMTWIGGMIFCTPDSEPKAQEQSSAAKSANSFDHPINISPADVSGMSGDDFAQTYADQWVAFNGLVIGTSQQSGDLPMTGVALGDSINDASFNDGSIFKIPATKFTFDQSLQSYISITGDDHFADFPRVRVIGRVARFDPDRLWIVLVNNANTDGVSASIRAL